MGMGWGSLHLVLCQKNGDGADIAEISGLSKSYGDGVDMYSK